MGLKVTDIQDKNSQTREIQDKDLANQTSVSQVNTSDYIMLQDTSGGYHKIARTSFVDAIRDAIGPEIANVAKGTDIAKIPVLDSSNGLGIGTLANVASVLGACYTVIPANTDLNNCSTIGVVYVSGGSATTATLSNLPNGVEYAFSLYNIRLSNPDNIFQQILLSYGKMYIRYKENTWGSWYTYSYNVPAFYKDYSDLTSLANALITPVGGFSRVIYSTFNSVDDAKGNYIIYIGGVPTEWGSPVSYGALFCFSAAAYYFQIAFPHKDYATVGIKYRMNNGTSWGEWKKINLE